MTENKTILVVDDDHDLRSGLTAALDRAGYRTLQADDGTEARQLIDRHRPDLVILDMMMPRLGGLAVLEHFQGQPSAPRFIMITGNDGAKHKNYAEQLGVVDYIRKPFSMDRLLEGVDRIVRPRPTTPRAEGAGASVTLRCRCPHCGSRIKAPVQLTGQKRECPKCKRAFVVVILPPDDEGAKLVMDGDSRAPVR